MCRWSTLRMLRPDWEERARAYHEAGHAVMRHAMGWKIEQVSIQPDEDSQGRVESSLPTEIEEKITEIENLLREDEARLNDSLEESFPKTAKLPDDLDQAQLVDRLVKLATLCTLPIYPLFAGIAAQVKATGLLVPSAEGARNDLDRASEILGHVQEFNQIFGNIIPPFSIPLLEIHTRETLQARWCAVTALARILQKEKWLEGCKAEAEIVTALDRRGVPWRQEATINSLFGVVPQISVQS